MANMSQQETIVKQIDTELGMQSRMAFDGLPENDFRTFLHPVTSIEETIRRAGFRLVSRRETWVWSADVYARL
jgi:hypothetical protein